MLTAAILGSLAISAGPLLKPVEAAGLVDAVHVTIDVSGDARDVVSRSALQSTAESTLRRNGIRILPEDKLVPLVSLKIAAMTLKNVDGRKTGYAATLEISVHAWMTFLEAPEYSTLASFWSETTTATGPLNGDFIQASLLEDAERLIGEFANARAAAKEHGIRQKRTGSSGKQP